MSPSKVLFFFCLSFIAGIFLESVIKIPQVFLWGFLVLGLAIIFFILANQIFSAVQPVFPDPFASKKFVGSLQNLLPRALILGFCVLFLVMGILRMQISEFYIANNRLIQLNDKGQVTLNGTISDEPNANGAYQKIKIKTLDGFILVTTDRYPEYEYLDKVRISGKLEAPMETEDFSYKNYLMKDGIYSVMGFPKIEKIGKEKGGVFSIIYSGILSLKQKLRESLNKNFSPPESLILQGMILGDRTVIPEVIKKELSVTGVSHIIAVSGTHIVILTSILMAFLLAIGLWRGQAFYFSVIFICFYILLVGLPASGVRSGIMGILYLFGQKIGRQSTSSRIIVLAGSLMLLQNPLLLLYDIGFQLSFLAVLGLIYFEPLIRAFFKFLIKKIFRKDIKDKYDNALMMLSSTISAQVFTLPIIIYNFGNISFISPIVNILLLPIIYYLMLFGFLSAILGTVFSWLGWIFSIPCYFLMMYFMKVVEVFSKPWAYKIIENVHWIWLLISYFIIVFIIRVLNKRYNAYV